jgi:hypothetical protein
MLLNIYVTYQVKYTNVFILSSKTSSFSLLLQKNKKTFSTETSVLKYFTKKIVPGGIRTHCRTFVCPKVYRSMVQWL